MDRATTLSDGDWAVEILRAGINLGIFEITEDELTFLGVTTLDDE